MQAEVEEGGGEGAGGAVMAGEGREEVREALEGGAGGGGRKGSEVEV